MALSKWKILTVLLGFVGTIQSQSILLSSKQFDFYAKALIERNGLNDSLQECKEELQECSRMVSNLELKVTGTEVALDLKTQISDSWSPINDYVIEHFGISQKETVQEKSLSIIKSYLKKAKWLKVAGKALVFCVAVIVAEAAIIYVIVSK